MRLKSKYIVFVQILILLNGKISYTQNLVSNGGFELFQDCPCNWNSLYSKYGDVNNFQALSWYSINGTIDYFNRKCRIDSITDPSITYEESYSSILRTILPSKGDGYVGLSLYSLAYTGRYHREQLQVKLKKKLERKRMYCCRISYLLANFSTHTATNISIHFSTRSGELKPKTPSKASLATAILNTGSLNKWNSVSFLYIAKGGEEFITIGNC